MRCERVKFLAEKYVDLLTKEDIMELFKLLVKAVGNNKSKAAALCGLTRKTTYDWKKIVDLKGRTKRNALSAFLDEIPQDTFRRIADRSFRNSENVVASYFSAIHALALQAHDKAEFVRSVERFDDALTRYAGLIVGSRDEEISRIVTDIMKHGTDLNVNWYPKPMPILHEKELGILIPPIAELLRTGHDLDDIAREMDISPIIVTAILNVIKRTQTTPTKSPQPTFGAMPTPSVAVTDGPNSEIPTPITAQ